ncbi:MAG: DUF6504 family protein [Dehalococcoidia bacterium]
MPVEFIGKPIEVEVSEDEARTPLAFRLGRKEHRVAEVLQRWEEHAFGQAIPGRGDWRSGQQRVYYRLRTSEGEVYEVYVDWLPTRRRGQRRQEKSRWFAYRRIA